jgi:hypothetical protein
MTLFALRIVNGQEAAGPFVLHTYYGGTCGINGFFPLIYTLQQNLLGKEKLGCIKVFISHSREMLR